MRRCLLPLILYFMKLILRIQKKQENIVNIFLFIKISCQSKESPLSKKSSPLVQPHPIYKKYFFPTLIVKLEEVNLPAPL